MTKKLQIILLLLLVTPSVFAKGNDEKPFGYDSLSLIPAQIIREIKKLFSYPTLIGGNEKPFGFDPIYIEGSQLSYFEDLSKLVVIFPPNIFGPEDSGYNFQAKLPPSDTKVISYEVLFNQDFDFVKGGKLPGLCGGKGATGGDKATGKNGFSTRVSWKENGRSINYVYHVHQNENYGDQFQWVNATKSNVFFQVNVWQKIRMQVKMNDIGEANGSIQTYLNDQLVFKKNDFVFRTVESLQIDRLCFNTFFGGNDDSWAPRKQETLYIRNLEIED